MIERERHGRQIGAFYTSQIYTWRTDVSNNLVFIHTWCGCLATRLLSGCNLSSLVRGPITSLLEKTDKLSVGWYSQYEKVVVETKNSVGLPGAVDLHNTGGSH